MPKPRIVSVLGMHRSGTSAVTRGLTTLGVDLGQRLMPARPDNVIGFFEDEEVAALNDDILSQMQSSWHAMAPLDQAGLISADMKPLRQKAVALLHQRTRDNAIFGMKDPRLCLLLPFWRAVFEEAGLADSYVVVLRNPQDVAASLARRDDAPVIKGLILWLKYTLAALDGSDGKACTLISYETLLDKPHEQLARMGAGLNLETPKKSSAAFKAYAWDFLSEDLRHEKTTKPLSSVPAIIAKLYEHLSDVADDSNPLAKPDRKVLDAAQGWLGSVESLLEESDKTGDMLSAAWRASDADKRSRLQDEKEIEARIAELARERDHVRRELLVISGELGRTNAMLAEVRLEAERHAERSAVQFLRAEKASALLARETDRFAAVQKVHDFRLRELSAARIAAEDRQQSLVHKLAAAESSRDSFEASCAALEAERSGLRAACNELETLVHGLGIELGLAELDRDALTQDLEATRQSTSWKLAAPLRWGSRAIRLRTSDNRTLKRSLAEWYWLRRVNDASHPK